MQARSERASELVSYENITPEEWEESKIEAGKRKVITLEREAGQDEAKAAIAKNAIAEGFDNQLIAKLTGLPLEEIAVLRAEL
jgi:hypothetical protein